jgi:hypothetical protein
MDARDSIGELVTRHAESIAIQDKVAQQLGRAITRAMNPSWGGGLYDVTVEADLACDWYEVQIVQCGPWPGPPQTYVVAEEALARNTDSVASFHSWVQAVSTRLLTMFRREPAAASDEDPNRFLATAKERIEHRALLERTAEELAAFGFRRHDVLAYDERAAIESIKRVLNDG